MLSLFALYQLRLQLINVTDRSGSKVSNILKSAPKKGITKKIVAGKISEKILDAANKKKGGKKEHNEDTKRKDKKESLTTPSVKGLSPIGRIKKFILRR